MKKFYLILLSLLIPLQTYAQDRFTLARCQELALQHNYSIKAALHQRSAASNERKAAFTHFLPSLNFAGTYMRMNKKIVYETPDISLPLYDVNGNPVYLMNPTTQLPYIDPSYGFTYFPAQSLEFGQKNNYAGSVAMIQPLFMGGKILNQYKIHKYYENITDANARLKKMDVVLKTHELYWQLVSLLEKRILAQRHYELIDSLITDLEAYFAEGIIANNDLLKARVKLHEAELNVVKVDNAVSLAKMALCQLIGVPLHQDIVPADCLTQECVPLSMKEYYTQALKNRPEIEMLQNTVNVSKALVKVARSRYMPNIIAQAQYMYLNPNPYNSFDEEFGGDWTVGVTCQFELFHWNERGFSLSAAKEQQKMNESQYDEARELIFLEVQQNVFQVNEAAKKVAMTQIALDEAEENLHITTDNFAEGIVNSTEVFEAQTLWQKAYSENIDAKVEYTVHKARFLKAIGAINES